MKLLPIFALAAISLYAPQTIAAPKTSSVQFHTPKVGSSERRAILDALRPRVKPFAKGKRVVFYEVALKVGGGWAYVSAVTRDDKGKRIGPEFTDEFSAVLRQIGGRWKPLEGVYATDVISLEWEKKYPAAPRKLWPHN